MKSKKKKQKDLNFILGLGDVAKGTGTFFGLGVLTLSNTKNTRPIGSDVDKKDLIPGRANICFSTEASVSELIVELVKMRKDMRATKLSTVRHSNKRGKVSRKGTE